MTRTATTPARRRLILGVPAGDAPWLLYLGFLALQPSFDPGSTWVDWAWLVAMCVVFVPIYGWTHRNIGTRPWLWRGSVPGAVLGIAAMVLLGMLGSFVNTGSATFTIYAMAAAGKLSPRRYAVSVMVISLLAGVLAFFLSPVPIEFRAASFVPAVVIGPIIGISTLFDRERRATNAKLRMAQEEVEQLAAIAERERIARDLHDLLGHTLSTITLKSELAANLVQRDPERATSEIRDVERLSRETLAEVRSVVGGYRSTGLAGEMANAKLALQAAGIQFDHYMAQLDLQPAAESVLALGLREAITNVVRHAGATRCTATLEADAAYVMLTVQDDGRGSVTPATSAEDEPRAAGFGLSAMRERTRALGGFVTLDPTASASRSGTRLVVALPRSSALQGQQPGHEVTGASERPATT